MRQRQHLARKQAEENTCLVNIRLCAPLVLPHSRCALAVQTECAIDLRRVYCLPVPVGNYSTSSQTVKFVIIRLMLLRRPTCPQRQRHIVSCRKQGSFISLGQPRSTWSELYKNFHVAPAASTAVVKIGSRYLRYDEQSGVCRSMARAPEAL